MPHALIVHAHPEPNSFCSAQMREAARTLTEQGYTVEISDLYGMGWNAELGRGDFTHPLADFFKPQAEQVRAVQEGTFAPEVAAELEKLRRADLLVFSFPMWWFSLPALLKGWVDRVFAMGAAYGGGVGTFAQGAFRGRRALLLFTTGSLEEYFGPGRRDGEMDTLLFHIQHGMFYFVGYTVLAPVVSFAPVRQTPEEREAQLRKVRRAFAELGTRQVIFDFQEG
ncbi:NAD(P)H dehydrogenase (quinone) [Deinococcus sp. HSC-46F16]|uniref:NAD(P)H-dependent oxidoreductase n=1 Tax=Deinococcus sp. HSC-46F16 TaxID=2910968 RepID=UPI00209E9893|nr:NAD(P)H-dependent oxidoreductase [Deinococcus sp. HSC-46F16]MCP2014161.1 NAD(P)H dehydrogenase (quinone) [Deinococcus sp. HSC-46F16]